MIVKVFAEVNNDVGIHDDVNARACMYIRYSEPVLVSNDPIGGGGRRLYWMWL